MALTSTEYRLFQLYLKVCHRNVTRIVLVLSLPGAILFLRYHSNKEATMTREEILEAVSAGKSLYRANLFGANLSGADLSEAKNIPDSVRATTSIVPDSGCFTGWKKCKNNVIVKLLIPTSAKRSNATGRKCRASHVKVLSVIGADQGMSMTHGNAVYEKGKTVTCDSWNEDRWQECAGGIHFFITRWEAENYE